MQNRPTLEWFNLRESRVDSTAPASPDAIRCVEVVERLTDYLDDALDPADTARTRRHLDWCAGCQNYFGQFTLTMRIVSDLPAEPLPAEVDAYLRAVYRDGGHKSA